MQTVTNSSISVTVKFKSGLSMAQLDYIIFDQLISMDYDSYDLVLRSHSIFSLHSFLLSVDFFLSKF